MGHLKTDASAEGPERNAPALVGAAMMGDRADVIFADPSEISVFIVTKFVMKTLLAAVYFCFMAHGAHMPRFCMQPDRRLNCKCSSARSTLEAAVSNLKVTDGNGIEVSQGKVQVNNNTMRVGLKSLNAGVYKVNWRAVSTDTHRTDGSFTFRIKAQ
jgi:CopC domain